MNNDELGLLKEELRIAKLKAVELQKAEQELISAKEKAEESVCLLKNITDNIPAYIAVVDIDTLRYKYVSVKFTTSFNKKMEEIIGAHISEIIGEANTQFAMKHINEVRQGKPSSYVNTFNLAEGVRYINVNYVPGYNEKGELKDIIVLSHDISEIKNSEIELRNAKEKAEQSEQDFNNLLNNTKIHLWAFNGEVYNYCNKNWYDYTGQDINTPLTIQLWLSRVHPEDIGKCEKIWIKNWKTKTEHENYFRLKRHDNKYRNFYCHAVPIFNKDGSFKHFQGYNIDITEMIIAKEKAEQSDKLKTAFLQNMSHEIRTPMNAIIGFSDLLEDPNLSTENRKNYLTIIKNSSHQLLTTVNDIITISSVETKQEKLNLQNLNVNSLILDLVTSFKSNAAKKNIPIITNLQLTDLTSEIYSDCAKLNQILSCLLSNALKFTDHGCIEVGYTLKTKIDNNSKNELEFYVKDSGIGIKKEFHEKIFERFSQADEEVSLKYGGTGLGLTISKAFTELLGGRIWVKSEINTGSIFYFTIPYNPICKEESVIELEEKY